MQSERVPATIVASLRARNERIVRVSLAAYLLLVAVLALSNGVQLTPDVLVVGLALGTSLLGWRLARAGGLRTVGDWLPLVVLALAYELIRAFGPVLLRSANVHIGAEIDRALLNGTIGSTLLQGLLRPSGLFDALALAATAIYAFHTLIPVVVGCYLWHVTAAPSMTSSRRS